MNSGFGSLLRAPAQLVEVRDRFAYAPARQGEAEVGAVQAESIR